MGNQSFFYTAIAGFALGIFASSFTKFGFSFFLLLCLLSAAVLAYVKFISVGESPRTVFGSGSRKPSLVLIGLFIMFLALGILRYDIKDLGRSDNNFTKYADQKIQSVGVVSDEPNVKENGTQLVISAEKILADGDGKEISGKILVRTGLIPEYQYGDRLAVSGELQMVENFSTTSDKVFDYESYLAKDDIYYQVSFAQIKYLEGGQGSYIKGLMFKIKNAFMTKINNLISEPESTFLGGLLLGAKSSFPKDLQNDFRNAGVIHIVALSGYNITIVAEGIMAFFAFLPRAISMSFGAIGILLFALMTGGSATVIRASVMALLVILSKATARTYDITRALLVAGVFMLIQNPKILVFDTSFQLSFMATLALIFVSPIVEKRLGFITAKFQLRELIMATIATQIFVLPFLLYKMGVLSLVSLPANLLILPLIPTVMLAGFLTGSLAFISPILALPVAFISYWLLIYMLKVIGFFAHLPFAILQVTNFSLSLLIFIYVFYGLVILRENLAKK